MEEKKPQEPQSDVHARQQNSAAPVRPRVSAETAPIIQHNIKRQSARIVREQTRSRGLEDTSRPTTSSPRLIRRITKREPGAAVPTGEQPAQPAIPLKDWETIKKVAWAALAIAIVVLLFFGMYALRHVEPKFQFEALENTQNQMMADMKALQDANRLERVKNTVLNAHIQLLVRKDFAMVETLLTNAKEDIDLLLESLPAEKKEGVNTILDNIEKILQEIHSGPASFDEKLKDISLKLENM